MEQQLEQKQKEQQLEQKRKELALEQQNLEQKELGLGRKLGQMELELEQTRWIQGTQWCRWFRRR